MEDVIVYVSLLLSVITGGVLVLLLKKNNDKWMKILLAFSGAFLLGISFLHLIPEAYESKGINAGAFILAGFLFQLLLEFFSEGIEHGHIHLHKNKHRFPLIIMLSLCIHAFVEGIPLEREIHHLSQHGDEHGDHSLLLGVVLHNIPVSLALMSMFLKSGLSTKSSLAWLMVFAVMGPLGTFFGHYFGANFVALWQDFFDITLAIVIGMFLHISTTILFESSEGHRFNFIKMLSIIAGMALSLFNF